MVLAATAAVLTTVSACSAKTTVGVDADANGAGQVVVTVDLDRQAAAAVGNVAAQLQTADLVAAGWQVSGPTPESGGSERLQARHRFSTVAQVGPIVDQVAGSGPPSTRPFQLSLTGSSTGIKPASSPAGVTAGQVFHFQVEVHLPGSTSKTNATSTTGATSKGQSAVSWQPVLGREERLVALSQTDTEHVDEVIAAGAAAVAGLGLILAVVVIRRRR